jgi:hypothetical protein
MTISLGEGIFAGVQKTNSHTNNPQPLIQSASKACLNNQQRSKKFLFEVKNQQYQKDQKN